MQLNGDGIDLDDPQTVAALVATHAPSPRGVAVAVNGEVVPRSTWDTHRLAEGDRVELLVAAQGG